MSRGSVIDIWLRLPVGRDVLAAEQATAAWVLDDVFGFELLQIGRFGEKPHFLTAARTQHSSLLDAVAGTGVTVCGDPEGLPFATDALDGVLLPHTLELAADPYAVLREAVRVLRPEGQIVIFAFNPWSLWGLRRAAARYLSRESFPPNLQRLISVRRMRDWVSLLGCDVAAVGGYLNFMPWAGSRQASGPQPKQPVWLRGGYVLKARKRVSTMTMVRPRWRTRPIVQVGAAEPTPRMRA
jgi:SAM-dependent methyltransferase